MIRILRKTGRSECPMLFEQMFRARAEIFNRKHGWDLDLLDGLEVDSFDEEADPLYIVALDADGNHTGSLRLLPSTGPTLLLSWFGQQFDQDIPGGNPALWECSRFCVEAQAERSVAAELLIALCEWALASDVQFILGSFELPMERIYNRIGWRPAIFARSRIDRRHVVGLWEATPKSLRNMCGRINFPVNEDLIADFLARNAKDDIWVIGRRFS